MEQPALCIVAPELEGLSRCGGIGTSSCLHAQLMAERGWRVHVLFTGKSPPPDSTTAFRSHLAAAGIRLHLLEEFPEPACHRVPGWPTGRPHESDFIRHVLEVLHREHCFDLIKFADWLGQGFRSVQARRAGIAFANVGLIVQLHGMSAWCREANGVWAASEEEVLLDHCERSAFEHADVQLGVSRFILGYARGLGWGVRADALVLPNPLTRPVVPPPEPYDQPPQEIVFFGRLERRKGLDLFLEALADSFPELNLTFLGKDTWLREGVHASELIGQRCRARAVQLLTDCDREAALRYLVAGNRLAVIPSHSENLPHTVAECLVHGIPFLAADVGGVPDLLPDEALRKRLLFEPTAAGLRRKLAEYLAAPAADRLAWRQQGQRDADQGANHARIVAAYDAFLRQQRQRASLRSQRWRPLVSVAVSHYNLGKFLPETLASLAAQTWSHFEVLVVDDGSTDPHSLVVFREQERRYPEFRFLRQAKAGLCAARNRALALARGEFFLPVDADNVARPNMVERFAEALLGRPECAALTCYFLRFEESAELARGHFQSAYRPTGGPLALASEVNVFGDANAIFRTEVLRSIGGYPEPGVVLEDWVTFLGLLAAGHRIEVIPEYLFDYRIRPGSLSRLNVADGMRAVAAACAALGSVPAAEARGLWAIVAGFRHQLVALADHAARQEAAAEQAHSRLAALADHAARQEAAAEHWQRQAEQAHNRLAALAHHAERLQARAEHWRLTLAQPRYRVADRLNGLLKRFGVAHACCRAATLRGARIWKALQRRSQATPGKTDDGR